MMFKVGDHVIGNVNALMYGITTKGWRGEVIRIRDNGFIRVRALPGGYPKGVEYEVLANCFDLIPNPITNKKVIVTTDGVTTTARLYDGKTVLKSAEAKCSPCDEFNFETGAALAVDRLLGRETEEPDVFNASMLITGRFGRMSNGVWFVVVGDTLVYIEPTGGFDDISGLDSFGAYSVYRIDCIVAARSVRWAKKSAREGKFIYVRPGAKFE